MADLDEDLPITSSEPQDIDLTDETQDFRFLTALTLSKDPSSAKIPKRGEKDFEPHATDLQASILDASRQAMYAALSVQRVHNEKGHMIAVYDPEGNGAWVPKPKGTMFKSMGRTKGGNVWLEGEEALYLLERGSLDVRWPVAGVELPYGKQTKSTKSKTEVENEEKTEDVQDDGEAQKDPARRIHETEGPPMSLQAAYAAFIGMEEANGGYLTLEKYSVYSGLRRAGYAVMRSADWASMRDTLDLSAFPSSEYLTTTSCSWYDLWKRLLSASPRHPSDRIANGPLATPGLYRSYADIYRILTLIPSHDPKAPPALSPSYDPDTPFRIHYHIWKPTPQFRKSSPPPPDFLISVLNARDSSVPTLHELNDLLATTPFSPPRKEGHMYANLRNGWRNCILAVVDQGVVSYVRLADAGFSEEKLYERSAPRGGKRGRGGGRGRGRGQGRGK